ncbi:hypothetical protein A3H22_02715 [Candidatus Peribacteria bacterium RIFCSPLOWO2_12_FULL_55_15]|nr:MAG: hypothetical protein A2789_04100 [Candidatus Peribacteria bacterium RIFCSPHIGHO2_01_FULL_54_22]OGJ63259.1 MAG: hypothetical protein A3D12_02925 [Candidatus Peribacteria bacterium RIFCSPHIGHO2_02_FULL_55_24]OGJ63781.1 MAG: hypothetical protein A3E47_00045 [Candidatus Peribacteria bacterium RIFCSPHIGHO2_12_FULL_54_10]OGJ70118.1 MAG: hypothetical protein A3H90_03320 [Candidatus Peribacteria bacterium RIFCSPLOWO2_02_FULL_55_36]OGJ70570.1 MAG: hypothetical protein A3H22_02715 [Candidatus Per
MLLFRWTPAGLVCSGGPKSFAVFPQGATDADFSFLSVPEEEPQEGSISWPGEYDIAGMAIRGIGQNEGQQVSYVVSLTGTRCAFISSPLGEWSDADIAYLGNVDLLVLPGENATMVQKLLDAVDPRLLFLLPSKDGIDREVLKVCGAEGKEHITEYKLKGALPAEGREVVVFGG